MSMAEYVCAFECFGAVGKMPCSTPRQQRGYLVVSGCPRCGSQGVLHVTQSSCSSSRPLSGRAPAAGVRSLGCHSGDSCGRRPPPSPRLPSRAASNTPASIAMEGAARTACAGACFDAASASAAAAAISARSARPTSAYAAALHPVCTQSTKWDHSTQHPLHLTAWAGQAALAWHQPSTLSHSGAMVHVALLIRSPSWAGWSWAHHEGSPEGGAPLHL